MKNQNIHKLSIQLIRLKLEGKNILALYVNDSNNIVLDQGLIKKINAIEEFEIININEHCSIRASFHQPTNKKLDIIINPEMSFGTGHHETTRLMAKELFNHQLNEKSVLDFGVSVYYILS